MARRIGDPATIASALTAAESALHAPHTASPAPGQRGRDRRARDRRRRPRAALRRPRARVLGLLGARRPRSPRARARRDDAASRSELRQPAQLWMLAAARATLALAQGRFAEAPAADPARGGDRRACAGLERGRGAHAAAVPAAPRAGRARRLPARGQRPRARVPLAARAPVRARARLLRGSGAPRRRRRSCARSRATTCRTGTSTSSGSSASACSRRPARSSTTPGAAASLYDLLLPYAAHNAVAVPELALDSASRPLGILATLLGRFEDAARHFRQALRMNERMGGRPWVAHTRLRARPHAAPARRRRRPSASDGAPSSARATYRELRMQDDLARADALARSAAYA